MILTRTHALYFAARRLPAALRSHAQDVTIDQVVNAHMPRPKGWPGKTEPGNTLNVLRTAAKRGGAIDLIFEWAGYGWPGLGQRDEIHGYQRIDRRYACAIKWAKKITEQRERRAAREARQRRRQAYEEHAWNQMREWIAEEIKSGRGPQECPPGKDNA